MLADHVPDSLRKFLAATAGDAGNKERNRADQCGNEDGSEGDNVSDLRSVIPEGFSGHGKLLFNSFTYSLTNTVPDPGTPNNFRNRLI